MRGTLSSLTQVFLLVALGCRSSAEGAEPIAREDYCQKLAKDACSRLVTCCNGVGITTNDETCLAREVSSCETQATTAETKGYAYDPQAAGDCLAGTKMFHDGCATTNPGFWASRGVVEACARVFHGTARLGDACKLDDDCAPSGESIVGCDRRAGATTAGKCVAYPRANRGEPCNLQAADGTGSFVGCKNDSICVSAPSSTGTPGPTTCTGPAAIGQACTPGDYRMCADGSTCDPTTHACTAPRGLGETCGSVPCASPYVCQWTTSKCVEKIAVGAACRTSDFCVGGAACVGGTCRTLSPEGTACSSSDECMSRYCQFTAGDYRNGTCSKVYDASTGGVDTSACRAIQVK
jgi:hypothetical protein